MAAVPILIFGETAGFKIVLFIARHVKIKKEKKKKNHGAMKKKKKKISANHNSPICMKTTDIKLFSNNVVPIPCNYNYIFII